MRKRKKVKIRCDWCDKIIFISYWEFKNYKHHFCNQKCRGIWASKNLIGKYGLNYKNAKIKIQCCFCKKKLLRYKNYVKKHKHNFCNLICRNKWMSKYQRGKEHPLYDRIKIKCAYCGKICYKPKHKLKRKNRHNFCSKECTYKWRSKFIKGKNHPNWRGVFLKCDWCRKKYKAFPRDIRNKKWHNYCGFACRIKGQSKFLIGKYASAYIHGKGKEPYILKFNNFCREQIRIRDGYRCQLCYKTQNQNKQKLSIHHIDYSKNHADPKKLITLCRKCNVKVNSDRDYWYAYFTYILNEKYK